MMKFLLALSLCMTFVGLKASEQPIEQPTAELSEEEKEANRKEICAMGFSLNDEWIEDKHVKSLSDGIEVELSADFKFKISDEEIDKLIQYSKNPTQPSEPYVVKLSGQHGNILKCIGFKVEERTLGSSIKGKVYSLYSGTYYPKYFEITTFGALTQLVACSSFKVSYKVSYNYDSHKPQTESKDVTVLGGKITIGQGFYLYQDLSHNCIVPLFTWTPKLIDEILGLPEGGTRKIQVPKSLDFSHDITLTKLPGDKVEVSIPSGCIIVTFNKENMFNDYSEYSDDNTFYMNFTITNPPRLY